MKSEFLTDLVVKQIDDKTWALEAALEYQSELLGDLVIAPKDFTTDFSSVPRIPFVFWFYGERAHRESVIHDFLYKTGLVPRKIADKVFLEAMKARRKNTFVRYGMYWGVRLGGWKAWNGHRKNNKRY